MTRIDRRAAAFALALGVATLAGCRSVEAARAAQDPASAAAGERTPTAAELGLAVSGPVALDALVRAAQTVHPSVVRAARAADAARSRCRQTEAAALPQITASIAESYRDQESQPRVDVQHRFESYGFDVSWLVFDFGRTSALERQAGEQWLAAQADLRAARSDVAFAVRSAYHDLTRRTALASLALETVRQFEERASQVRAQMDAGTRLSVDVTAAEVALAAARLDEVKARDAALAAQAAIANAVGLAEVVDWRAAEDAVAPPDPQDFDAAWDAAHRSRPSLAAAAARERAASALIDARVAALYPSLDVGFGFTESGASRPLAWNWSAGPTVRWVPFDGWQNVASVDESVANLRAARADRAAAEQQAWLDVRTSWLGIEDAQRRLELSAFSVRSAEENLALVQARFDLRAATSVELTDAQQSLAVARAEVVQARADRAAASAKLARAVGADADAPGSAVAADAFAADAS
ncbi:MAG: TolC family protein, partial [Planctomycetes bacterium]|nr:TolC family protein [Planctomycetota bacterium]